MTRSSREQKQDRGWSEEGLARFRAIFLASMQRQADLLGYKVFGVDRLAAMVNASNPSRHWSRDSFYKLQRVGLPGFSNLLSLNLIVDLIKVGFLWNDEQNRAYGYEELITEIMGVEQSQPQSQLSDRVLYLDSGVKNENLMEVLPQETLQQISILLRTSLDLMRIDSLVIAREYNIPRSLMERFYFGEWGDPGSSTAIPQKYLEAIAKICYKADWINGKPFIDTIRKTYAGDYQAMIKEVSGICVSV